MAASNKMIWDGVCGKNEKVWERLHYCASNSLRHMGIPRLQLTLDHMRVVLQEEVVQVLGDEGRHAGIRQRCEEYRIKMKRMEKKAGIKKYLVEISVQMTLKFLPSLLKFRYRNGAQRESKPAVGIKSEQLVTAQTAGSRSLQKEFFFLKKNGP